MKRFLALLIIFCLFALPCHAGVTGAVSLANIRLSLDNGTAFVDFSAAGTLNYLNGKLTLTDSAGKKAIGYIKSAGTGETFGDELVTNGTFTSDVANWTVTAPTTIAWNASGYADIARATGSGLASQTLVNSLGMALKGSINVIALSNKVGLRIASISFFADTSSTGVVSGYMCAPVSNGGLGIAASNSTTATCTVDDVSVKQVLTPSATGATITSTRGGTTYNWASIESGFDYNDSSGYTYTIVPRGAFGGLGMGIIYGF